MTRVGLWAGIIGLLAVAGCRGASPPAGGADTEVATASFATISVDQLHDMLETKDFVFVNVHVPYEGDIPGTDRSIPFDRILEHRDQLPTDTTARIVLYCRSGRMSETAAAALAAAGYTNVVNVAGGMKAWEAAGHALERRPEP